MTENPAAGAPASGPAAPPVSAGPDPNAALSDVRNQLVRLGQQIAEMRTEPATVGADAANGIVAELREAVRFLAERLDGVARMVAQRGEELADTRGALGAIDAHVRSQAETIAVLTTGMQALPSYGERVAALQDNISGLQQRLGGIENAFAPLGQRLGGIEQAVARPADGGVTERLAAIEGMLGPLSQRLGQALAEQSASLQALHGRVEAVASGTQAALATPVQVDDAAVAALEPRLAGLLSEVTALRDDLSALKTASPAQAPDISADLAALHEQIAALAAAAPAVAPSPPGDSAGQDVGPALQGLEQRLSAHVDEAILALAKILLGKGPTGVSLVDTVGLEEVATGWPHAAVGADAEEVDEDEVGVGYDAEAGYDEPTYGNAGYVDVGDEDTADDPQIDFSAVDYADEVGEAAAWSAPAPAYSDAQASQDAAYLAQTGGAADRPFDQDAPWGAPVRAPEVHPDVVPERRRRWFSW